MSMGFAGAMLGLTVLAMAALLVPLLLRQRPGESSEAYNLAVYRDQLAEVDRDLARGLVNSEQAEAARAEIGRRIIALNPNSVAPTASSRGLLTFAAVTVLVVPVASWIVYGQLGSPAVADEPIAVRRADEHAAKAATAPHLDLPQALARLNAHLKDHPDDLTGWILLARSDLDMGRYDDAVSAYTHAVTLSHQRLDLVGDLAEARVLAAAGTVTPEAKAAFEQGLKDPNTAPRSRYYLALYKFQHGDPHGALQEWVDLEGDSPKDAAWLPFLRRRIDQTASQLGIDPTTLKTSSGKSRPAPPPMTAAAQPTVPAAPSASEPNTSPPSPAEVAAAEQATRGATSAQREAMIRGMVANLAAKLQQNPDDIDGWVRLGRSYMVLGDPAKAADAYAHAIKLQPGDPSLKAAFDEAQAAASKTSKK